MNIDAYRQAHAALPLTISIDGRAYQASQASYRAVCDFEANKGHPNRFMRLLAMRRFLRSAFPFRWRYLRPGQDPVSTILRLTSAERGKVLMALLGHTTAGADDDAAAKLKQLEAFING